MIFADAHLHITDLAFWQPLSDGPNISPVCSCAHSEDEWKRLLRVAEKYPGIVLRSAGVHPQNPDKKHMDFVLGALEKNEADAIGEAGFDLYSDEFSSRVKEQEEVWALQLEAAQRYEKPLVIHCRRALDRIFRNAKKLAKLKSVVFHSFAGSDTEALSLIKRGVNAHFSFGKPLLNGNKRALRCAVNLPFDLLLAETDAPWQTLKGETATDPADIKKVYEKIASLRGENPAAVCERLYKNFKNAYGLV